MPPVSKKPETEYRDLTVAIVLLLGLIPALAIFPYWVPGNSMAASASSVVGFNNSAAHLSVVVLATFALLVTAFLSWRKASLEPDSDLTDGSDAESWNPHIPSKSFLVEPMAIFAAVLLIYCPIFLAKQGPFQEDSYFLSVLHRMQDGQRPYLDFETLYGPLLIYPAYWWTQIAGYSMRSYYMFLGLLEAVQFAVLIVILRLYIKRFLVRILTFVAISVFLVNTLLGLNWNGIRRVSPVLILLLITARPRSKPNYIIGGVLIGLLCGYSHDFGILTLLAVGGVYGLLFVNDRDFRMLIPGAAIGAIALIVWAAASWLVLDQTLPAYLQAAFNGMSRFAVEASFPFYWTLNSIFTFALFCLTVGIVGNGLGRLRTRRLVSGDLLIFAGLVYAFFALKSGLNRADMWHLAAPLLVIVFTFLLPLPFSLFRFSERVRNLALVLIALMAATYFIALAPTGSYVARGWVNGMIDTIFVAHPGENVEVNTRAPMIETERSAPRPDVIALARYLAEPKRRACPVVPYGELWGINKHIGVFKTTYPNDDFLLSDQSGVAISEYLRENRNAIVVIDRDVYRRLHTREDDFVLFEQTATKRVLSWTSTVHFWGANLEYQQKERRWARTVGLFLKAEFEESGEFENYLLLESKNNGCE